MLNVNENVTHQSFAMTFHWLIIACVSTLEFFNVGLYRAYLWVLYLDNIMLLLMSKHLFWGFKVIQGH